MTPQLLAVAAVAAVGWSVAGPRASLRVTRPTPRRWPPLSLRWLEGRLSWVAVAGGAALPVAVLVGPAVGLAAAVLAGAVAAELRDGLRERRRRAVAEAWRAVLSALSVALTAGLSLPNALVRGGGLPHSRLAGGPSEALSAAAAAAAIGGDAVTVLETRCRSGPGARLAGCLRLATSTGVPPAVLAARLGDAVAAEEQAGRAATVALASARATTRVLAVLPLAGVGLAGAFGASAPAYLLAGPGGHACLLAAAVLEAAGLRWSARLVRRELT